jgi:hypothetical protein
LLLASTGPPLSWAWLHSIAVFAAISKIRPLPSLRAFCSAVL